MISKKEYNNISSNWEGKIYQKWKKLKQRLPMIINNLDFFENAKVLELGCNAGIYALCLYPYIKGYVGIEKDKSYYKQALETLKEKKVHIIHDDFKNVNLELIDYDLFIASYVLHHLNDAEVNKLEIVFKKCNKVAIHTRSGDPLKYGHDEIGLDPVPKWCNSRIREMLSKYGYKSELHMVAKKDYNGVYLILAKKNGND